MDNDWEPEISGCTNNKGNTVKFAQAMLQLSYTSLMIFVHRLHLQLSLELVCCEYVPSSCDIRAGGYWAEFVLGDVQGS